MCRLRELGDLLPQGDSRVWQHNVSKPTMKVAVFTRRASKGAVCAICEEDASYEMVIIETFDHYKFCASHYEEFMTLVGLKKAPLATEMN